MADKNKQQNEDPFKDLVDLNDLAGLIMAAILFLNRKKCCLKIKQTLKRF